MTKAEAFSYASGKIPASYRCSICGATQCKLWRQYQTMAESVKLLCLPCGELDQKMQSELEKGGTDAIGWLVPAVPTEDRETFWGYTSVPQDGCDWWDRLPNRPGGRSPFDELSPYMKHRFEALTETRDFLLNKVRRQEEALDRLAVQEKP